MSDRRVYLPRQRNRPPALFQVLGRTYGAILPQHLTPLEELREAYLSYRPALDDVTPPPNPLTPPVSATDEELFDDLPDVVMPEFDEMREPNVLVEAQQHQQESLFRWESGMLQLRGKTFSAEQVADIMKVWLTQDD